jgi:hypothetical protein
MDLIEATCPFAQILDELLDLTHRVQPTFDAIARFCGWTLSVRDRTGS